MCIDCLIVLLLVVVVRGIERLDICETAPCYKYSIGRPLPRRVAVAQHIRCAGDVMISHLATRSQPTRDRMFWTAQKMQSSLGYASSRCPRRPEPGKVTSLNPGEDGQFSTYQVRGFVASTFLPVCKARIDL